MKKVQVEILGLSSSPSAGGAYALLLKETYGVRRLPIIIGAFEAQAIALELEGIKPPRPLTHDLLKNMVDHLGGIVQEVYIDELKDNTFYAKVVLEVSTLRNEIDSRPSDAIALSVRTGAPIYISEDVMDAAAFEPSSDDDDDEQSIEDMLSGRKSSSATPEPEEIEDFEEKEEPVTGEGKMASLQDKLREAIEKEDYERAAKLRDEINRIKGSNN